MSNDKNAVLTSSYVTWHTSQLVAHTQ